MSNYLDKTDRLSGLIFVNMNTLPFQNKVKFQCTVFVFSMRESNIISLSAFTSRQSASLQAAYRWISGNF